MPLRQFSCGQEARARVPHNEITAIEGEAGGSDVALAPLRRSTMASNAHPPSHQRPRLSPTYVCVSVNSYIMTRQYSHSVNLCVSRGREKRIETSGRMRQTPTFQERETRDRNIVLQG